MGSMSRSCSRFRVRFPSRSRSRVSADDAAVERCEYCEQPFPSADRLALHKGTEHRRHLDETERGAVRRARDEERETLRLIRLKALLALTVLYFSLPIAYALAG